MRSALLAIAFSIMPAGHAAAEVRTVHFPSEDHHTRLTGYLFEPQSPGPHAAIVLLHGRAGPYSSLAKGVYNASTLSKRHKEWGSFWAAHGYLALLVDSFGPRGFPAGFPAGSYDERPAEVSEQTARPLDAYGALRYLRSLPGVIPDRIGVQGWSNGGMTVLATMSDQAPGLPGSLSSSSSSSSLSIGGFRAALAEYPGCGMKTVQGAYRNYAPILLLIAANDEEVSPQICQEFAARARQAGHPLQFHVYPGAEHNYDDPGEKKQSNPANHRATEDTFRRAEAFFARFLDTHQR
jgi:dienelactone hydrolase